MSDPARDGYQCHGPMIAFTIRNVSDPRPCQIHAWWCACGVWRHALPLDHPLRPEITAWMIQNQNALHEQARQRQGGV